VAKKKAFLLRISPELWADLSGWAADELRSVNGHIEYLLRQALAERRARGGPRRKSPPDRESRGGSD
jgi:hypothetical protein